VFGLFDRRKRKVKRAKDKELVGDLDAAIKMYVEAELPDEAARVLLLKADAEHSSDKRLVLCAQAARIAEGGAHGDEARRRKALIGFDLVRSSGGTTMKGELVRVAGELEAAGEWQKAVEAYQLAGDVEAEIKVLKNAGAIESLEQRLREASGAARKERDLAQLLRRIADLDQIAERREAIRSGRQWLEAAPLDEGFDDGSEQVELEIDKIRSQLLTGPIITLEVHGAMLTYVLGSQITIGRAHADIVVHSSSVSRQHLRLFRDDGVAMVEDLDTRNGSMLAGARISGALPIGDGLDLELAGQVPCRLAPAYPDDPRGPIAVDVAGETLVVPLGALTIGDWQLTDAHDGDDRFVVLTTPEAHDPPYMAGYRLAYRIELCAGDELRAARGGPVAVAVPAGPNGRTSPSGRQR